MRNVESHLLEDKMDEAVTHYINSQPPESVHVDANSLALNIQDDGGGRVVTLMHSQNFQSQMCRQISVGEQVGEGPWGEDLLDPEGRLAVLMAHITQNPRTSHHQSHSHLKISSVRSDVDGSVILDTPYGQSLEPPPDSITVQVPSLPPLPPLQDMKRCSDTDWFDKDKTELKNDNSMLDETGGVLEMCAGPQKLHKKSLPHKKRISKKLKRNGGSTPQQDLVVINCAEEGPHEEILPDSFAAPPPHQMRALLICQLCGEFYGGEQLKFYQHLKQHYEPHTTIIIENPVPDLAMDKMTNTCIVDNVATLPDSIVELSLENTVPKNLYQDKHMLYDKSLGYNKYAMVDKDLEAEKAELYGDDLDKLSLYSCVKCNKSFRRQTQCEAHIKEAHSNPNPKLEDMGEFSETEDLMEGIHVAVDDAEQYDQALLPHLVVDNGHVHQEHVRAWYMRNGANGTPVGPLCECGGVGYCEACTPHVMHTQTHHAHVHMSNAQVTHMAHAPVSHAPVTHGHCTSHASTHVPHIPVTSHVPSHVPASHASAPSHVLTHAPVSSHMQAHVVSSHVPAPSHVPVSHVPVSSHVPVTSHGPTTHMPGSSHVPVSTHVPVTSHQSVMSHVRVTPHVPASSHALTTSLAPSLVTTQRPLVLKEEVLQGIFDADVQNSDNGFDESIMDTEEDRATPEKTDRVGTRVGGAKSVGGASASGSVAGGGAYVSGPVSVGGVTSGAGSTAQGATSGAVATSGGGASTGGVATSEGADKKQKRYECGYCSRVFEHRNSLLYHVLMHGGRQQTCRDCGKSFYTATALKIHKRVHSDYRPCKCDECGKDFKQWSDLKYHKASIHSNQKNFKCEFCGKEFARRYSLSIHRRIHTGERNYKCDFCSKTFRASSYRLSHMRTHTGSKPHKCTHCDKRFRVAYDLRRHLKIHDKMRGKADEQKSKPKETVKEKKAAAKVEAPEKSEEKFTEKNPKTTRLPVLKSILDKKQSKTSKRAPKKAPNVTVQGKDGHFKISEYSDEFVKQEQYLNDVYEYKDESAFKKVNYAEERSRSNERTEEKELATLRPMFRNQIVEVESDRLVFNRESTDGKMQVFTHVEKKEYTGPIVSNAISLSDIRSIDRDVSRGSKDLHSEAMDSGFFERLTSFYNIPAV